MSEIKKAYENFSSKASDVARQLSFAGIALVWVFRSGTDDTPSLERKLLIAALLLASSLACDIMQYLIGTLVWYGYFRKKEKDGCDEEYQFLAPVQLNWPIWLFFWLKSVAVLAAYFGYIVPFLVRRLTT